MGRKKIVSILVGSALVLVAVFGAVTYHSVFAQTAAVTPSTTTASQAQPGQGAGLRDGYSEQDLANALGIDLTTLQAAEKLTTTEALKQAVSAGLITQAQADQIAQGSQNGHPFDGRLPFLGSNSTIDTNALLANALGISTDQLQAAKQKAYFANIDLAVTNGTMTQAQADLAKGSYSLSNNAGFQSAMKAAFEAAVKQAVADGLITQAQADQVLANSTNGFGFGSMPGHGNFGGGGGHGGPGGGNGGAPGNTTNPPAAPATVAP